MNEIKVDAKNVREVWSYNEDDGLLRWRDESRNKMIKSGDVAGSVDAVDGYIIIRYKRKAYKAHRLAWLYAHGKWPSQLDHINGCPSDNRICNLREVTTRQNHQNMAVHRNGRLVGATKVGNRYYPVITVNGHYEKLGSFATAEEAHEAYMKRCREISEVD